MSAATPSSTVPGLRPGVRRREIWAWAMYDFANSGYTTVVITAIFNAYFVAVVAGGAPWATFAWTATLAVSYVLILLSAPLLGAWTDAHGARKRLLAFTTAGCVLATAALGFAGPGSLAIAMVFLVLSNFCFGSGENLIAAFLPELADESHLGKVSGWGWSLGYIGGLVSLGACLGYIGWAQARGQGAADFVPVTLLITAALFAVASAPTFLFLRERRDPVGAGAAPTATGSAWTRVHATLRHARDFRDMRRFMLCIVFYQAGIQAVIALAAIYAEQAMGFATADTIKLIFLVNITAAIGAFAFGQWQDRLGHVRAVALTLLGWIVMILLAWSATTPPLFWLAANIAGLCLGASQSAGRALIGYLAPAGRHGEFFGLWGLAVKLSSILGPLTYGSVTWMSGGDHRLAILVTGSYFVVGLFILAGVDAERGRRAALASV
ncbi:MFS transporter [Sulfurisoma sediminicola]|uniref:UMF1 family MFS transporter n=1 Tax=Sulfurisoma sediminicola TaxID=1381557 RepID=A0A497XDW1_9PROT|nr:MFS transporter [Sulfurisoma sediminicola]RLJ65143.1 UMF1 family MFS transporter [Sulfurisoma sediminicola]